MFLSFFIVYLVIGSALSDCPKGFIEIGSDCWKIVYNQNATYFDAVATCASYNATVVTPDDGGVSFLEQWGSMASVDRIWIGVTCSTSSPQSCYDAIGETGLNYTNFDDKNPNPSIGACTYMILNSTSVKVGKWYSTSCNTRLSTYYCIISPYEPYKQLCEDGYQYFNGFCYGAAKAGSSASVEESCVRDGGHTVSIHSPGENSLALDIADVTSYVRTGLIAADGTANSMEWTDDSEIDYRNFGVEDTDLGWCVSIAGKNGIAQRGQWVSNDCSNNLVGVCKKRPLGYSGTTPAASTTTAALCSSTIVLKGQGEVESPFYPSAAPQINCEYLITEPNSEAIALRFQHTALSGDSYIELYDGVDAIVPALRIVAFNSTILPSFQSSTNSLVLKFFSDSLDGNSFNAAYNPVNIIETTPAPTTGCNAGLLTGNGTISTPNYPANYPNNANCQYLLGSTSSSVSLTFQDFVTELGFDTVTIYDGDSQNANVIKRLSGTPTVPVTYTSTQSRMLVIFTSDASNAFRGFFADFNES